MPIEKKNRFRIQKLDNNGKDALLRLSLIEHLAPNSRVLNTFHVNYAITNNKHTKRQQKPKYITTVSYLFYLNNISRAVPARFGLNKINISCTLSRMRPVYRAKQLRRNA